MSVKSFFAKLYPGEGDLIGGLRNNLEYVATSPGLTTALLIGPSGCGKTTMAKALAIARMLESVNEENRLWSLDGAATRAVSNQPIRWYRDISLAGLSKTLAEAQLFGVGKKIATGVSSRIGLFEQAMTGSMETEANDSHQKLMAEAEAKIPIAVITGGVVLLDEIADLDKDLQAKLLRVLNGEMQYRLGTEGNSKYGFSFRGLAILATWQDLEDGGIIREDLWQRICQNRISVPGISDYPEDARIRIIQNVEEKLLVEFKAEHDVLSSLSDGICSTSLLIKLKRPNRLERDHLKRLARVDWKEFGQFRGLSDAIRRIVLGYSIEEALNGIKGYKIGLNCEKPKFSGMEEKYIDEDLNILRLFLANNHSVSEGWKQLRFDWSQRLSKKDQNNDSELHKLLKEYGKDVSDMSKELRNIMRSKVQKKVTQK